LERTYIREMLSRLSDKKIIKKAVASSATPSVGNVSLIGKSEIDLSKVQLNGQAVTLSTDAMQVIQTTPGTAEANKAIVVNSSKNIEQLQDVSVNELYVDGELVTGVINTGATVSDSSYMNNIQPGSSAPGKIMSLDSDKNTSASLLSSKNLILNGGSVSALSSQSTIPTSEKTYMSLESVKNIYIVESAHNTITRSGTNSYGPWYYAKIGKIYLIHYRWGYVSSGYYTHDTYICQDIYAANGGSWSIVLNTMRNILDQEKCWYDSTTDRHYIPYYNHTGSTSYNLCVYVSPTGEPNTWTAGQWTSYTVCSTGMNSTNLEATSFPVNNQVPMIRWSSLLNKFVIMGYPPAGYSTRLTSLFTSTDGTSWTRLSTLPVDSLYTQMIVTNSAIYVFTNSTTMYYTTNGTTWNSKTLATALLADQSTLCTHFETLDLVIVGGKKRNVSTIIPMSAGAEFNQSSIETQLTTGYVYYEPLDIYFTNSYGSGTIFNPSTQAYITFIGYFVGDYVIFPSFNTTTFANSFSFRFNINIQPPQLENVGIIDPSTYLCFESKTKSVIYDFAWAPAINKYIVLGIINDGFNSTYETKPSIYHSDDLETFSFVSYLTVTNATEMCYNPDLNALYVYTRSDTYILTSTNYGRTFSSITLNFVEGIYYIPLLKSTLILYGNNLILNYKNPTNFTSSVNSFTINGTGAFQFTPETMSFVGHRQSSGLYISGDLLGAISGMKLTTTGSRSGFYGSYTVQSIDSTITRMPRYGQVQSINGYNDISIPLESNVGKITSGVQMSNIEYIDHAKLYVAFLPASTHITTSRFVFSYNMVNWFEPTLNQLSVNISNLSFYSIRYDKRTGYLYVLGTNGFFKTINSFKSLSLDTIPSTLSNYNGLVAESNYRDKLWPFANIKSTVVNDIDYCRGTYVACKTDVIMYGQRPHIMSNVALTGNWLSLAASKDKFVVVANDKLAYSATGASWTNVSVSGLSSIYWSPMDSKFGAVGTNLIAFSSDGITWSTFNVTGDWKSIKYNNGYWLAVGLNKIAYTSTASSPTVMTLTGDWKDSSFGGQWIIVGTNACAFSTKVNDITNWIITPTSGSYSNVQYSEDLRAFFLTGVNYSMYMQRTNTFVNYSYATESTKCKWFYRMQCFVLVTNQGLLNTKIIGKGIDTSLCHSDMNNIVTRTSGALESSFNINELSGSLTGNQPIYLSVSTANEGTISFTNNSDGSVSRFVNDPTYTRWETGKYFNLNVENFRFSTYNTPYWMMNTGNVLSALSITNMGTVSGDNYLSTNSSGNMTASQVTSAGFIINGFIYSPTAPSAFGGVTQGIAAASKGLLLNSSKEVTGIAQLSVDYLTLSNNPIACEPFNINEDSNFTANGQSSLDCSNDTPISGAYNDVLDIYAAVTNQQSYNSSNVIEKHYIMVSKDGVSWHKAYTGQRSWPYKIVSVKPGSALGNSFNLGNKYTGFLVFFVYANSYCKSMFTPDCVNFYYTNMSGTGNNGDLYVNPGSLMFISELSTGSPCVVVNNGGGHPYRILRNDTTGINTTWASTTTENNYIWASSWSNQIWGVNNNSIITHTEGGSTSTSLATGETCNAACGSWNSGGSAFKRIVVTESGKVLHGVFGTASTSLTVDASVSFKSCAYNHVLRRFIIGTSNRKIYLSDVDSVTSWTAVTVPTEFNNVSWIGCEQVLNKGFMLWHALNNSTAVCSKKICFVDANGNFSSSVTSFDMSLKNGCYGLSNYVVPVSKSGVGNKIMYSNDGIFWNYSLQTTNSIMEVKWTGTFFVAISSVRDIYRSTDLINWTTWTNPRVNCSGISIRYSPSRNLVVAIFGGSDHCVSYSSDGINWTNVVIPQFSSLSCFEYSPTLDNFVFSPSYTEGVYAVVSSDLQTFTTVQSTVAMVGNTPSGLFIYWIQNAYYMYSHQSALWKSTDGLNWEKCPGFRDYNYNQAAFMQTSFLSIARQIVEVPVMGWITPYGVDPDGTCLLCLNDETYRIIGVPTGAIKTDSISSIIYNPDANALLLYKKDVLGMPGETFQVIDLAEYVKSNKEIPIDYIDKMYSDIPDISDSLSSLTTVSATLEGGASSLKALEDLINSGMVTQSTPGGTCNAITYGNDTFVIVGSSGYAATSSDCINWTTRTTGNSSTWRCVIWASFINLFVALGDSGAVMTSPNGITWTARTISTALRTVSWISVNCSSSIIVAVGANGTPDRVMTSTDGINWTARSVSDSTSAWQRVIWVQYLGLFSAVASAGTVKSMYSTNGINWIYGNNATPYDNTARTSLCWSEKLKLMICVSTSSTIGYSFNGKDWKNLITPLATPQFNNIIYSEMLGCFYAVHSNGSTPAYSCDGFNWYRLANSAVTTTAVSLVESVEKKITAFISNTTAFAARFQKKTISDINPAEAYGSFRDFLWSSSLNMYIACCHEGGTLNLNSNSAYSYDGINWKRGNLVGYNPLMLCEGFPGGNSRIIMIFSVVRCAYSDDGINWTGVSISTSISPASICWANNQFVCVGTSYICTSPDGITWTQYTVSVNNLKCVCWGTPGYVAVSSLAGQTDRVVTSTNGSTWVTRTGLAGFWSDVAWSPTLQLYVAVSPSTGDVTKIASSPDGITWTARIAPSFINLVGGFNRIRWNSDHFVGHVQSNVAEVFAGVSYDGINWYVKRFGYSGGNSPGYSLAIGNKFIQGFNDWATGTAYIENYMNGATPCAITDLCQSLVYLGNDIFLASTTTASFKIAKSTNKGLNWTNIAASNTTNAWRGLAYSPSLDRVVAVSQTGTNRAMYSNDKGSTWTGVASSGETNSWQRVTYGNDLFVAVAATGTNRVMYSSTGTSWTGVAADAASWNDLIYASGKFVAVGGPSSTSVMYSSDGSSWTAVASADAATTWTSITWSDTNSLFIASGSASSVGKIMTSPDGITWTSRSLPVATTNIASVCAGPNLTLALAVNSTTALLFSSIDCVTWTRRRTNASSPANVNHSIYVAELDTFTLATSNASGIIHYHKYSNDHIKGLYQKQNTSQPINKIYWYNNEFIACHSTSQVAFSRSDDGRNWTKYPVYTSNVITGVDVGISSIPSFIAYGNGIYVSFLQNAPKLLYSTNLYDWTRTTTIDDSKTWNEGKFIGNLFIAVGLNVIARSTNGITWTISDTSTGSWQNVTWVQALSLYIAVGNSNKIITSPDGITWTQRTGPNALIDWKDIAWSPSLSLLSIIGSTGVNSAGWSTDGINWNSGVNSFSTTYNSIVWDSTNSIFIAAGAIGSYSFAISKNGIKWTGKTALSTGSESIDRAVNCLAHSPSLGIVVSGDATDLTNRVAFSRVFELGNQDTVENSFDTFWDVIWSNSFGRYCAFKKTNTIANETQQYFSMDGYTWTVDPNGTFYSGYNATSRTSNILGYVEIPSLDTIITCRGTAFVQIMSPFRIVEIAINSIGNCVGISYITSTKTLIIIGSTSYALCATDPTLSQVRANSTIALPASVTFAGVLQCNGKYLMVQSNAASAYYISSDLNNWTAGAMPSSAIWKFASESTKRLVAASNTGVIAYTDDGTNWTTAYTGSQKFVNVRYLVDQRAFVACDYNATSSILVSLDNGANWQSVSLSQTLRVSDICYSPINDRFVIVSGGEIGGNGVSSITVSLPKIPAGGNVLRFHNGTLSTNTFQLTAKGGIMTGNRAYNGFTSTTTENQPLLSLDTNSAYKPSSSAWTIFSDERIKKDIVTLDDNRCLEIVKNLPLKYYKWLDQFAEQTGTTDKHKLGWIAQDVQELIPTAIRTIGDYTLSDGTVVNNLKTLSSDQLIVCMHGAMRALIKRYEDLELVLNENA